MIKLAQLVKMAKEDREFLRSLMHIAKTAADKDTETQFNESVPAASQQDPSDPNNEQQGGKVQQPTDQSQVVGDDSQIQGASPDEIQGAQEEETPEAIGARAAQSFVGPEVFQAALSGDQNAIEIISRVAGQVAAMAASGSFQQAQQPPAAPQGFQMSPDMQQAGLTPEEAQAVQEQGGVPAGQMGDPSQQGAMGQPAQSLTPEEQIADLIVAPQAAPAAMPMESPEAQPGSDQGPTPPGGEPAPAGGEPKPVGGEKPTFPPSKGGKGGGKEEGKKDGGGDEDESIDSETVRKIVKLVKSGKL